MKEDHIRITIPRSKQDQIYAGTRSYIPEVGGRYCPVMIFKMFQRQFGFEFGPQGNSRKFLNFMLYNDQGQVRPKFHKSLGYSSAMAEMKEILAKYGIRKKYSENSFKSGGVTAYIESGNSLEASMIHGRWRGLQTPLYYLRNTDKYRLELASKVPKISEAVFEI